MSIEESLKKILFEGHGLETGFCQDENCDDCVRQLSETGRWYITFGHAGFNSKANNGNGYISEVAAKKAMKYYLNR